MNTQEKLPSVFKLISDSWSDFFSHFKYVVLSLPAILAALIIFLLQNISQLSQGLWFFIFIVLFLVLYIYGIATLLYGTIHASASIQESYTQAFTKFFPLVWVTFLATFLVFFGYIILLVPALIFGVWYAFSQYVLFEENIGGTLALMKSKEYVKGKWWATFGRILVFGILLGIVIGVSGFLSKISQSLTISILISILVNALVLPFSFIFTYKLFRALKKIKGGDVQFTVTTGRKARYIVGAILGIFAPIIFTFVLLAILGLGQ